MGIAASLLFVTFPVAFNSVSFSPISCLNGNVLTGVVSFEAVMFVTNEWQLSSWMVRMHLIGREFQKLGYTDDRSADI